ncbi:palmitoyl-protein thioesterase 1 [Orussus abietinus]|uniref:palmitoyl-protein thioesterase 1 n=1 Tax=Orussus abietinus TaxID=222816 RepID=UPI0006269C6A|nr:palmitoyl-protein thioesterase 1 [Orussus abietinus]
MFLLGKVVISVFFVTCLLEKSVFAQGGYLPIILWHGMGDSCCFSFSLGQIETILKDELPGVYIKSIMIGNNEVEDVKNSYFGNLNDQVQKVCDEIKSSREFSIGYNAIGFSQGAQLLRALVQRCDGPPVYNLISLGGQHQGVYGWPNCASLEHKLCDYLRRLLNYGAYTSYLQNHLVQAQYWHDPLDESKYARRSLFLAEINNEYEINSDYINRLQSLTKLVLVKFENDTLVQPIATEWFGFYEPGQATVVQQLQQTRLFKENRLGLQDMYLNQIDFLSVPANHLQFTDEWFVEKIVRKYLKPPIPKSCVLGAKLCPEEPKS